MGLTYKGVEATLRAEITDGLRASANRHIDRIQTSLEEQEREILDLARSELVGETLKQLSTTPNPELKDEFITLKERLIQQHGTPLFRNFFLFAKDGRLLVNTEDTPPIGSKIGQPPLQETPLNRVYEESLTLLGVTLSEFSLTERNARRFMAAPVWNRQDGLQGIAVVELNDSGLFELFDDYTGSSETGEAVLVTKVEDKFLFLTQSHGSKEAVETVEVSQGSPNGQELRQAVLGGHGEGEVLDQKGREVLAVWRYIPLLRAGLVIKIDSAEAFAPIGQLRDRVTGVACLTLLVVTILAGKVSRFFSNPIRELTAATVAMTHGTLAPITIKSSNEMGQLAESFNSMIAQLKERDDKIRELEERRFQALVRNIPGVTFRYLLETRPSLVFLSGPVEDLTGYSSDEFVSGQVSFESVLQVNDMETREEVIRKAIASGSPWQIEYRLIHRRREIRWAQERGQPTFVDGKATFLDGIILDISQQKQSEDELREARLEADAANQAKSDFLANVSHEIRTPMNAIIGLTHLALRTELTEKQHDYLEKVYGAAQSLLGLINDVLDFSKIEAGMLEIEKIDFSLEEVLQNLCNLLSDKAEEKGLELFLYRSPEVPERLVGDPLRLGQVLINLTNNALKFTHQGEVVVRIELLARSGNDVVLRFKVVDTGIGMTKEQLGRLFQSFSQADTSTTRHYGGTGLGLAISKNLVELMDGKIEVESEHGVGSTFWFTARFGVSEVTAKQRYAHDLRGLNVLIVDDNATAREILSEMSRSFTFQPDEAESGQHALEAVAQKNYDLIFMDWKMPGMSGIETLQKMREGPKTTPPVIMVTNYGREEVRAQSERVGVDGFLIKPVTASLLFDAVARVFGTQTPGPAEKKQPKQVAFESASVLLVEDNEINQQVAREMLESMGLEVTIAGDGQQAIELLQTETAYDLVLMDIQMPVMDGHQATEELRRQERFQSLPIIAMTAHALTGDRERCLESGMNDHLTKPIDMIALERVLSRWLTPLDGQPTTPSKPSAAQVTLPPMGTIDTSKGLLRLNQNTALYHKLLLKFRADYALAAHQLSYLATTDTEAAKALAHSLKGVAGNLGAERLFQACANFEQSLASTDYQGALLALQTELTHCLIELQQLEHQESSPSGPTVPREELLERLASLQEALESGDALAGETLAPLRVTLDQLGLAAQLKSLDDQLDNFELDEAAQTVRALRDDLEERE